MSGDEKLLRLSAMAGMVLDVRSAALSRLAAERDALKAQLAALNAPRATEGLAPAAAAQVRFDYETWASRRRAELNLKIAAKHAEWLSHLDETRQAFGRAQVLDRMLQATRNRRSG
ncbi:hypothetical protein LHP98_07330 [Rhodobacter sp. Har01]|uniref:hypothetical protein n=1 Tax=Rhodobacter sp. Har01 TaxID=2883999 RepID=UPI001D07C029|nr:hypothetical protein [Rhodobacter sp. Har01]MCB6177941.1 hypothetical protein [Rhodobacter sp. Har01]